MSRPRTACIHAVRHRTFLRGRPVMTLTLFQWTLIALGAIALAVALFYLAGFRRIPNNGAGVVEKRWTFTGSVPSGFIALNGEAGFQPRLLRGGLHWLLPFQYRVHIIPLVTIPQSKIGYIFARDGRPLEPTQSLASNIDARSFEDVTAFMRAGGQRGPQRQVLREGTYAINLAQFVVITEGKLYYLALAREDKLIFDEMAGLIEDRAGFDPVVIRGETDLV